MRDDLRHIPVLHTSVLSLLSPRPGDVVLDVTLGLGGHAQSFLTAVGPTGRLIGLDADADNLALAQDRLSHWHEQVTLHHLNFAHLPELPLAPVNVLFADLGLSSPHLDDPMRGFSFRADGPLDLRFDRTTGETAAEFLRAASEAEITNVLRMYGELPQARRLARLLKEHPPATSFALKHCVEQTFGYKAPRVLPQVFQALRMEVNGELNALRLLLDVGPTLLAPDGRMGIISFHSLEDRLVKQTFRALTTPVKDPITGKVARPAAYRLLTKKPVRPDAEEIAQNPRARSALLRVIQRTHIP